MNISNWMRLRKAPDRVITLEDGAPYLRRWHLIPRNRLFNLYLHHFVASDVPVPHDHPWWNVSVVLDGVYDEFVLHTDTDAPYTVAHTRRLLSVVLRRPQTAHYIELPEGAGAWTLFFTGPVVRDWGFWVVVRGYKRACRWIHWSQYLTGDRRDAQRAVTDSEGLK